MQACVQGYLPGEYECLNSSYGSEKDLRRCIKVLHANGIKAVADVVLNHRCAGKQVLLPACPSDYCLSPMSLGLEACGCESLCSQNHRNGHTEVVDSSGDCAG